MPGRTKKSPAELRKKEVLRGFFLFSPHCGALFFNDAVSVGVEHDKVLAAFQQSAAKAQPAAARKPPRLRRALAAAGQPQGGMVLLLGRMTNADVYAQAFRDLGLDCVSAGGSGFAQAAEVQTVRALVCALANPADTAQGLMPLLASPMFALGAQEFLALATKLDSETGETSRRNIDMGIMSDFDVPGLQDLPLVTRAREVLRYALRRVGRDSLAAIARDVVNASGWFVRLGQRGPEGKAIAANVLKALDAVAEAEAEFADLGYGVFKPAVGEAVVELVRPISDEAHRLLGAKAYLESIYKSGAERASYLANKTLRKVYKKVGFVAR